MSLVETLQWCSRLQPILLLLNVLGFIAAATLYVRVLLRLRRYAKANRPIARWDWAKEWVKLVFAAAVLALLAWPQEAPIAALYGDADRGSLGVVDGGQRRMVFE